MAAICVVPLANLQLNRCNVRACHRAMNNSSYRMAERMNDCNYVRILDTTLRDGEQSPGVALSVSQKLEIARQLCSLKVDIIDSGFPASSEGEADAVKKIAQTLGQSEDEHEYVPIICALSRCVKADISAAWEAVRHAKKPRILLFISTSEIHMKHKLNKTAEEVINIAAEMVAYARSLGCTDVQFGAEDAGRTKPEMLYAIFGKAIKAGATTVGIGDTVGYLFPSEIQDMTSKTRAHTPGIENVVIAVHCHNDLGLATSNTLAGATAGARQLEVTVNGIGERAGNASLEEVVMAMKCRGRDVMDGLYTGINTANIYPTSQMVSEYTGMLIQPHKAIVGANAFAHESGVHQDGILKNRSTYEILSPADIGIVKTEDNGIVLGKHSGRHALNSRLKQLGYALHSDAAAADAIFRKFKALASVKKIVTNADLVELMDG